MSRIQQIILAVVVIGAFAGIVLAVSSTQNVSDKVTSGTEMRLQADINNVILHTNKGNIVLHFYRDQAPKTVANFIKLAQEGFYDGTKFHRVIDGFMVQGGDPQSKDDSLKDVWGTGGPGYKFEDEFSREVSNVTGTVAMANSGPGTNGSQFFINVADNTFLDGKHTVFANVTLGMDVVEAMSKVETDERDRPVEPLIIQSVEIK